MLCFGIRLQSLCFVLESLGKRWLCLGIRLESLVSRLQSWYIVLESLGKRFLGISFLFFLGIIGLGLGYRLLSLVIRLYVVGCQQYWFCPFVQTGFLARGDGSSLARITEIQNWLIKLGHWFGRLELIKKNKKSIPMICSVLMQKSKSVWHHKLLCWWSTKGSLSILTIPQCKWLQHNLYYQKIIFNDLNDPLNVIQIPQNQVTAPAGNTVVTSLTAKNYQCSPYPNPSLGMWGFFPSNQATTRSWDLCIKSPLLSPLMYTSYNYCYSVLIYTGSIFQNWLWSVRTIMNILKYPIMVQIQKSQYWETWS